MKKISKLLMLAVVALGVTFTACNNDLPDAPNAGEKKGDTNMSVTLNLGNALRSIDDNNYNYLDEWGGVDAVEEISVYVIDGNDVSGQHFSAGDAGTEAYQLGADNTYYPTEAAAILTTVGAKTVYVVVNATAAIKAQLNVADAVGFVAAYKDVAAAAAAVNYNTDVAAEFAEVKDVGTPAVKTDKIVMTVVKPDVINVEPGITKAQTISGTPSNRAKVEVERMVARAIVTHNNVAMKIDAGTVEIGTLSDLTWAVAQGEQTVYLQRQEGIEGGQPKKWATPNWAWVPGDGTPVADFYAETKDKYDYSNLQNKLEVQDKNYANAGEIGGGSVELGQFLLPNTHQRADKPTTTPADYAGGYRKGNTAYVLVTATFTPTVVLKAEWNGTDGDKTVGTSTTYSPGGTFILGANGKFYDSEQSAYVDTGSKVMTKYENGKVLYHAWVNPDIDSPANPNWFNAPVLRNNIYHINITGFAALGTNWNPLFPGDSPATPNDVSDPTNPSYNPNDPNYDSTKDPSSPNYDPTNTDNPDGRPKLDPVEDPNGEPVNPEEPKNPIDPDDPLTTPETWMSVEVKVLPWQVHSYDIILK